ncbi:MAG: HAD family phosphatase [Candidatus Micrarchaeota archaeon]|nr:HAD family phosphatase [Candidatus Micrarchaeota archaeon]
MVDNMSFHKEAWKEFCIRHGLSLTDEEFRQKISGKKNNDIFELVFNKQLSKDEVGIFTEEKEGIYRGLYLPYISEIKGLSNTISILKGKGMRLAVATTAPKKNRELVLSALKLDGKFDLVLGDENVSKGKPDPEIYLTAAKELKMNPNKCLVFEDTPPGVQAGKRAGMKVVGILSTHSREELNGADYLVNDYLEISLE